MIEDHKHCKMCGKVWQGRYINICLDCRQKQEQRNLSPSKNQCGCKNPCVDVFIEDSKPKGCGKEFSDEDGYTICGEDVDSCVYICPNCQKEKPR